MANAHIVILVNVPLRICSLSFLMLLNLRSGSVYRLCRIAIKNKLSVKVWFIGGERIWHLNMNVQENQFWRWPGHRFSSIVTHSHYFYSQVYINTRTHHTHTHTYTQKYIYYVGVYTIYTLVVCFPLTSLIAQNDFCMRYLNIMRLLT